MSSRFFKPAGKRRSWLWLTVVVAGLVAAAGPLLATDVLPGIDLWTTPGSGTSSDDFSANPIPADFFDPGSDPFTGVVKYEGDDLWDLTVPSSPGLLPFDTVIRRLTTAVLPEPGTQDTVAIEIVALSLKSIEPITVTYNGGQNPELWDVQVCLSAIDPQVQGDMTIYSTCNEGGTFDSLLPVIPRLIFIRQSDHVWRDHDPGPMLSLLVEGGRWVHNPEAGLAITQWPPGLITDGNCDGIPDSELPGTSNFTPGVRQLSCEVDCVVPPPDEPQRKRMTPEEEVWASHGVTPAQDPPPDDDGDGHANDADNCPDDYNPLQEDFDRDSVGDLCDNCPSVSNPCQEDSDGNDIGDVCEALHIFSDGFESGDTTLWSSTFP